MCGITGIVNVEGSPIPGQVILDSMDVLDFRSNGRGAGFAAYGIYPEFSDNYAIHVMIEDRKTRGEVDEFIFDNLEVVHDEHIPTRKKGKFRNAPIPYRYFVNVPMQIEDEEREDYLVEKVMEINTEIPGAFVLSSGRNMGVFKGVGYCSEIGDFFKIDEYEAYMWTAHSRFPTNTPSWWGGAHPFGILDWSIVHNGEISSYGTNKRYVEEHGYKCSFLTDTEPIIYLFDLLVRRHGLPIDLACKAMSPPFWSKIDQLHRDERQLYETLRATYASAMVNGPFATLVARPDKLVALTDRIKLRPLVAAREDSTYYISSEEAAIRRVAPELDDVWAPRAGEPTVIDIEGEGVQ